jgi:hypothetical protein
MYMCVLMRGTMVDEIESAAAMLMGLKSRCHESVFIVPDVSLDIQRKIIEGLLRGDTSIDSTITHLIAETSRTLTSEEYWLVRCGNFDSEEFPGHGIRYSVYEWIAQDEPVRVGEGFRMSDSSFQNVLERRKTCLEELINEAADFETRSVHFHPQVVVHEREMTARDAVMNWMHDITDWTDPVRIGSEFWKRLKEIGQNYPTKGFRNFNSLVKFLRTAKTIRMLRGFEISEFIKALVSTGPRSRRSIIYKLGDEAKNVAAVIRETRPRRVGAADMSEGEFRMWLDRKANRG